ncbi:MAG: hypothetical protein ABI035_05020, partial [Gemmatimonadaceae bacterium]
GPEGGNAGGKLVAMGRPEEIVQVAESHTGRWLAPLLAGGKPVRGGMAASQRIDGPAASKKRKAG